jgi:O-antigen/teichoic acid export membrane protein
MGFTDQFNKYKTVFFYVATTVIKASAQIASVFLVAKYVLPEDLGLWTIANVFVIYSMLLNLGIISGMNRELPFNLGKGNKQRAEAIVATSMLYMWGMICTMIVVGIIISLFYLNRFSNKTVVSGCAVTLISAMNFLENFLLATYRSNSSFNTLSRIQLLQAILNITTLVFIYLYGFWGLIFKTVFVQLVYVTFLYFNRPFKVSARWDKQAFYDVLKVGFPIYILAYIQSSAATFDKVLLAKITDKMHLGYYSFGMYSFVALGLIPTAISNFIYPKLSYKYGRDNNALALWTDFKKIVLGMFAMLLPIAIVAWITAPYLLNRFFPAYNNGISAFRILAVAAIFLGVNAGSSVILTVKKWKYIVGYQSIYAVSLVIWPFIFSLLYKDKVTGVAFGVLAGYLTSSIGIYILAYLSTHK